MWSATLMLSHSTSTLTPYGIKHVVLPAQSTILMMDPHSSTYHLSLQQSPFSEETPSYPNTYFLLAKFFNEVRFINGINT